MAIGINGKSNSTESTKQSQQKSAKQAVPFAGMRKQQKENSQEEGQEDGADSDANAKRLGVIAAVAIVVIILAFWLLPRLGNRQENPPVEKPPMEDQTTEASSEENQIDTEESQTTEAENFITGDPSYDTETNQTTDHLDSADDFVKNLQGESVPVNYIVKTREYVKTHVNYVAKRAVIDDGMEMYWVDIIYKQKKYRAQVPYYYFKDLEEEGICRVEMEVLNLENGGQIISYMQIVSEND